MGRTVDARSGLKGRAAARQVAAIRAGLANGSMVRGMTEREAHGGGQRPAQGSILLPDDVLVVTPPLGQGQEAVAWEVIGSTLVEGRGWRAQVVGIRTAR